jgi:hypothetical protein
MEKYVFVSIEWEIFLNKFHWEVGNWAESKFWEVICNWVDRELQRELPKITGLCLFQEKKEPKALAMSLDYKNLKTPGIIQP